MKHLSIILMISISLLSPDIFGKEEPISKEETVSRHDNVYTLQHKLIPKLLFETDGKFFADLKNGSKSKLLDIAEEQVDSTFSQALKIKPVKGKTAYSITFQNPAEPPECYHVLLIKSDNVFLYYTLEKGLDLFGQDTPSVLCQWTSDGKHLNLGTRDYDDLKSFVDDVMKKKN